MNWKNVFRLICIIGIGIVVGNLYRKAQSKLVFQEAVSRDNMEVQLQVHIGQLQTQVVQLQAQIVHLERELVEREYEEYLYKAAYESIGTVNTLALQPLVWKERWFNILAVIGAFALLLYFGKPWLETGPIITVD